MTFFTRTGKQLPKVIVDQAENAKKDEVSRREFLALASTYGSCFPVRVKNVIFFLSYVGLGFPIVDEQLTCFLCFSVRNHLFDFLSAHMFYVTPCVRFCTI